MVLGRLKELLRIPALVGAAAEKAPLPILARESPWRHPLGRRRQLQWTVVTDKSVGGRSEASFDVRVPLPPSPPSPSEAGAAAAGGAGEGDGGGMMEGRDDGDTPLAVFSGELSTMRPSADPTVKRTGYCGVKIELPRPLKVEGYEGLELRVRTDGRNYVTNLEVSSFFPDELYQGYITGLPGGRWFTLQLPFRDMTLTRLGRLSYIQRDLDGGFTLESIGFLIADGQSGPFRLEVGAVSAISKITGRAPDDRARAGGEEEDGAEETEEEDGGGVEGAAEARRRPGAGREEG